MSANAPDNGLRLLAEDADDLAILSAALQDAVAQVGDIRFDARARELALLVNRFRWEDGAGRKAAKGGERVRAALHVSSVSSVKALRLRRDPPTAVVSVLALAFEPGDAPAGVLTITFAGGGALSCEVECLDVMLADLSAPWPTPNRPVHALD